MPRRQNFFLTAYTNAKFLTLYRDRRRTEKERQTDIEARQTYRGLAGGHTWTDIKGTKIQTYLEVEQTDRQKDLNKDIHTERKRNKRQVKRAYN